MAVDGDLARVGECLHGEGSVGGHVPYSVFVMLLDVNAVCCSCCRGRQY